MNSTSGTGALLAEADALREKWNRPRETISSVAEIVEELQAIAREALQVDITDADALTDLGERASKAGTSLEIFAMKVEEHLPVIRPTTCGRGDRGNGPPA